MTVSILSEKQVLNFAKDQLVVNTVMIALQADYEYRTDDFSHRRA